MSSQKSSSVPTEDIIVTPVQQMIASLTPLDVVKIRLQAQNNPFPKGKCFVYCNGLMDHICICENGNSNAWYTTPGHFTCTLDAFIKIICIEGVFSYISAVQTLVPATVIYFTCYDQLLCLASHDFFLHLSVGSATVISPLELVCTKMQSEKQSYQELSAVIRSALHNEDVPFSAMYWFNYEKGKAWLCQYYNCTDPTFAITFTAGALSGSFASVITLPFDVVKTKRQVELGELQTMKCDVHTSLIQHMKRIVAENGVSGLFAGFLPRLIKVAPACAIMISTYEFGKAFFHRYNQKKQRVTQLQPSTWPHTENH
uniref:Solute carrier family 25 member 40 n=1 Tax=Sinocyclocheilus rhinocerous TaxID=307959 RepID=A0A673J349_9TELE